MEQVNKLISYDFEHLSPSTTTFDYSNLLFLDDEDLSSIKDENVKQKILEFFEYYSFLKNNLNIFLNIFEILKNSNMNKPFFFDLKSCFPDEELFLLFLSASILRVLVKPVLSFKKNEYSFEWKNSTYLINELISLSNGLLVFVGKNKKFKKIRHEKTNFNFTKTWFVILNYLQNSNLIEVSNMKSYNNKNKKINTIKFYKINANSELSFDFNLSLIPFNIIKYCEEYFYGSFHYSTIKKLCKENKKSKKSISFHYITHIQESFNQPFFIDFEFLDIIINERLKDLNIDFKEIENQLLFLNKNFSDLLKKQKKNRFDYLQIAETSAKFNRLMFDANLFRLKNYFLKYKINKIFFSSFYDFRGRKYYDSIVGPTYSSICRYIFYYGKYEEYKKENCGLTSKIISNFYFFIEKLKNMLEIKNNELNEAIFWYLIAIAKHFIKKNATGIEISTFLIIGINCIINQNWIDNLDLKDKIECKYYIFSLDKLGKDFFKRGIMKDATSSVLQHMGRLLKPKNLIILKYLNMKSENKWYDTYSFIIEMFLEYISNISLSSEEKEKLNLFVRSSVKKSIMTDPYGVTFLESYKYFLEASKQEDSLILKKMFQYFYGFVNKEMEKKMYIKSSISLRNDILKQTKSNKQLVIATFDSVTDLIYFKIKKKEIDLIIENKRKTTSYDETTSQIDYIKLRSASRANIIHLIDALYMRDLTRAFGDSFITIHDCAYIDHMSISKFIQCANFIMKAPVSENIFLKNQLNDDCEIYSIFILL